MESIEVPVGVTRISDDPKGERLRRKIVNCGGNEFEGNLVFTVMTTVDELKQVKGLWYITFQGSRESLCVGHDKPECEVGDKFRIPFFNMRVTDDLSR